VPLVLILLPPSESKAEPARRGTPVDPARLSFPELAALRRRVLEALVRVSAEPDAVQRVLAPPSLTEEVARNTRLRVLPAVPVHRLYTGVLYDALDWDGLDATARRRGLRSLVVTSALWGLLRPGDRVPPYRVSICSDLPGVGKLVPAWRAVFDPVMTAAAGSGVVVDCRSGDYAATWRPGPEVAARTVAVRAVVERAGRRSTVSHMAKHTRGLVTRHLLQAARAPRTVEGVAAELSSAWKVELAAPTRRGQTWTVDVVLTDWTHPDA
jgi:uncharacterized protein